MTQHANKLPPQEQSRQPGHEHKMRPAPEAFMENYKAAGKLKGKIALVTGGDSGIGRAVCIGFAKEGADVAFLYFDEEKDAEITQKKIEEEGVRCLRIKGDIGDKSFCKKAAAQVMKEFGRINILVNNAAEQHEQEKVEDISPEQLIRTFTTNVFGMFYLTQEIVSQMQEGDTIINTASVTAYRGNPTLIDYSSTKGAIIGFTRALSANLANKKIRVNAVAPGPIWTPLIPASFDADKVAEFGQDTPLKRPGQPDEVAPSYIFLASEDASYMTGQVFHPNGGSILNT